MARLLVVRDERDEDDDAHPRRRLLLEDPGSGLRVDVDFVAHPAHRALVYGATLHNTGRRNIEHVRDLRSYDLTLAPLQRIGNPRVHTIGGGVWQNYYPTPAYQLRERVMLGPWGFRIDSGPSGRSSNNDLPFFLVEDGDGRSGAFGGIEW